MDKCLKILFHADVPRDAIQKMLNNCIKKIAVEGVAQMFSENNIRIIVCGSVENVDAFIDMMYQELIKANVEEPVIEPFLKDKDYRGVFRIIQ
jgi:acylphosphatase